MFRWFGLAALVACVLHALLQLLLSRQGGDAKAGPPLTHPPHASYRWISKHYYQYQHQYCGSGSGAFLTPGSGSGMNNPDHITESLESIFLS
jgi:hypothetical protein